MPKRAAEGEDGGQSSHIRTFLRIRPSKQASGYIKVDEHDKTRLGFNVPVETRDGEVSVMTACVGVILPYECVSRNGSSFWGNSSVAASLIATTIPYMISDKAVQQYIQQVP